MTAIQLIEELVRSSVSLPTPRYIARQLGLNPNTVRSALIRLRKQGKLRPKGVTTA